MATVVRFLKLPDRILLGASQGERRCVSMLGVELCSRPLARVRVEKGEGFATSSLRKVRFDSDLPVEMWCEFVIRLSMS